MVSWGPLFRRIRRKRHSAPLPSYRHTVLPTYVAGRENTPLKASVRPSSEAPFQAVYSRDEFPPQPSSDPSPFQVKQNYQREAPGSANTPSRESKKFAAAFLCIEVDEAAFRQSVSFFVRDAASAAERRPVRDINHDALFRPRLPH